MKKISIVLVISFVSLFSVSAQSKIETILSQFHADSLKKTVEDLVGFDNRLCNKTIGNNKTAAQYIMQRLNSYGIENAAMDSFFVSAHHFLVGDVSQDMYNVRSRLSGSINPDSIAIIGAHLDAISYDANYKIQNTTPGANDNATGVAVMIEIARIFHANQLIPKYSIDFMAYDAEEIGLYGSRYDAQKRKDANENIFVMLNNDMVGLQTKEDNEWKVTFHGQIEAQDIENKAVAICREYTLLHPYIPDNKDSSYRNSDSWAYRERGFRTFYTHEYEEDPHYHTIYDTPERLNYHYMAEIAKLHFSLLYDFAIENVIETGIHKFSFTAPVFALYPNPTDGQLKIKNYKLIENAEYSIYNVVGQIIMQGALQSNTINVESLTSGMYFLKVGNKTVRFVKE